MFWKRKKKMIDICELQRRGAMHIPRNDIEIPTNKEGFVELGKSSSTPAIPPSTTSSESAGNFLNFMDNSSSLSQNSSTPAFTDTQTPSSNLRKISTQISDLDNKIYKLEQRIELLERKFDIGH